MQHLEKSNPGNEIRVLSYNVCWGCMLGNKKGMFNSTAKALAEKCIKTKKASGRRQSRSQSCLQTVADHIDNSAPGYQLDFVGTQESANWSKLQRSSRVLRKMTAVHHLTSNGIVHLATFYNPRRWLLDAVKVGDLLHTTPDRNKPETGRPYHILYLTDIENPSSTDNKYIVINIHNGHQGGAKRLIRNLSANPDRAVTSLSNGGGKELDMQKEQDIYQTVIKGSKFRIIMMGDFNDGDKDQYYKGLRPFADSGISELKALQVSSQGIAPPSTCCTPSSGSSDIRSGIGKQAKREYNGDYILIGAGLEYVEPTHIPNGPGLEYDARKYPASDHLPVMAVIRPTAK
jgi:endonuclease/exonuclease/phosphatase family metal-dependent hydrolase